MSDQETQQGGLCENCLPESTVWATSTPASGPKSYFVLIKDGETQIALELKYSAEDKKIVAEPYRPGDYDYTIHDSCDHENFECILDTEEFREQEAIDYAAVKAGYKEPVQGQRPRVAFSSDMRLFIEGCISQIEENALKANTTGVAMQLDQLSLTAGTHAITKLSAETVQETTRLRQLLDMPLPKKDED